MKVTVHDSICAIAREDWNALAGDAYPFLRHEFLELAEQTGSVSPDAGWKPRHLALEADGTASFLYVVPDPYQLDLIPPTGWTITTTPTVPIALTLDSGEVENVTITMESVTEQAP